MPRRRKREIPHLHINSRAFHFEVYRRIYLIGDEAHLKVKLA